MASEHEPAKLLLPYLQRADELQKHEPLVAYYCRLYAMERGLKIPQGERTKTTNSILVSLMNQLEKDKKSLKLGPDDHLHLEGFASSVFAKGDKQDCAGRADLSTAKTFYAASIFFEILSQFGELQPELEQRQKYAAWKAADIRRALKEGRKPEPGPPADEKDLSEASSIPSSVYDEGLSRTDSANSRGPESDLSPHYDEKAPHSPQFDDKFHARQSTDILPSASYPSASYSSQEFPPAPPSIGQSPQFDDKIGNQQTSYIPPSPHYSTASYSSEDYQAPPPSIRSENSTYSHAYLHQNYSQEPQAHVPQSYHSYESPPTYSYPNFQSYPSFTESSLPTAPSHHPSFNQSSDTSFSAHPAPSTANYPSTVQHKPSNTNGAVSEPKPTSAQTYQYDCDYQPPPEKVAEAHKAARFAVGALAFDDVSVAVEFLRKSLELLTNPSGGQ